MKNPSDGMRTASRNAFEACGRRGGRGKRAIRAEAPASVAAAPRWVQSSSICATKM
jgi:hypothetical protein